MPTPLQLERVVVSELVVKCTTPEEAIKHVDNEIRISAKHKRGPENRFLMMVKLNVSVPHEVCKENIEMGVNFNGLFKFEPGMTDTDIRKFYPTVALANLMGTVRGIILQSTALFKDGPFLIPLMNLTELNILPPDAESLLFPTLNADNSVEPAKAPKKVAAKRIRKPAV